MQALLALSRRIDALNELVGKVVAWLILAAVLLSSINALIRYTFNESSNAWLEGQWYLFSAVFLLCAGYTLRRDEHIRIDIISARLGARARAWIDVLGGLFFLLPATILIMVLSWPMVVDSYERHEMSSNAGGLLRWPAKVLIPAGLLLLAIQGISEIIKRVAFLSGRGPDPAGMTGHARPDQDKPLDTTLAEEHAA
ncbi:MAG: sugar transporter [Rhodospirillales bacterium 70-18]|nr:TRAP transporter small permease subunit [Rhodospirillales bacterium]OJY63422.1 MAG: sugar transporter [Rhodospirillales bacterium 70-18]